MKKTTLICILCVVCAMFAGVLSAAADTVSIAINPDTKPFKYYDEDGNFAGIDAEIINAIAEETGLEFNYIPMDFSEIIDAVSTCDVDAAISALSITENRSKLVSFTIPYANDQMSAFARLANDDFKDIQDPAIKVIGAKAGTTAEEAADLLLETFDYEKKVYAGYAELFEALENDEIDVAIADEMLAKQFVNDYADMLTIGQPLVMEPYAIAVCPSNTELLNTLNAGLTALSLNGTLDEIILKNLE